MVVLMSARGLSPTQWLLVIIVVVGLAVDAFVHLDLASVFDGIKTSTLSQGDLFRVEAAAAVLAAVALLVRPGRNTAAFAFLVAAGGVAAVVLYRYVDVGAFGPVPDMYDPYWGPAEKTLSVVAEAVATLAALSLLLQFHKSYQGRGRGGMGATSVGAAGRGALAADPAGGK
jgi:hypothetical protein